jgi:diguanylate cyclase (GGDEF)-like protein
MRITREQVLSVFGLFGDDVDLERARDMNDRLLKVQLLQIALLTAMIFGGVVAYNPLAAIPLVLSELGFLISLLFPLDFARAQLPLVGGWLIGMVATMSALAIAGPPRVYLWAVAPVSIQFIGVIWTRKLTVTASISVIVAVVVTALLVEYDTVTADPWTLLPMIVVTVLTAGAAMTLRDVDFATRGAVLVDALTGLRNRVAMQSSMAELTTDGGAASVIVFDLDHFKEINDVHGHSAGDTVLRSVAERMRESIGTEGQLFRFGGEEFVAVLPCCEPQRAVDLAEQVRKAVSASPVGGLAITLSAGVASAQRGHAFHGNEVFRHADAAMYEAKQAGRNRVCVAPPTSVPEQNASRGEGPGRTPVARISGEGRVPRPLPTAGRHRWLVRSVVQRDQLLAVTRGFTRGRLRFANLTLLATMLLLVPEIGWLPAGIMAVHAILLDPKLRRSQRTLTEQMRGGEAAVLVEAAASMVFIVGAIVAADDPALYLLPLILVPVFPATAAYPNIASWLLMGLGITLCLGAGFLVDADAIAGNPIIVTMPIGLLASMVLVGATVGRSAVDHRAAAIIDPLTGLLNRAALDLRLPEISETATRRDTPVTVLVGDLDHFKAINDGLGHTTGDEVLIGAAERIRDEVRAADALYRVGGEEFVVLLAATQIGAGFDVAERIRQAIERHPIKGVPVTISIGVAAASGIDFRYTEVFARADAALLAAKNAGRNRVAVAPRDDDSGLL